jgi:hypothetical protein
VVAFCRIDDREIRLREPVLEPDALIIQDPTLLHQVDVFGGLARDGYVLINTSRSFEALGLGEFARSLRAERLRMLERGGRSESLAGGIRLCASGGGGGKLKGLLARASTPALICARFFTVSSRWSTESKATSDADRQTCQLV